MSLMHILLLLLLFFIENMMCVGASNTDIERPDTNDGGPITLAGTRKRFPGQISALVGQYPEELTRLLDVGACSSNDDVVSYVPPLDGSYPCETLPQEMYDMKFVLYDLQLVELKSVDPIGGSFQAEIQMVFHWIDYLDEHYNDGSNGKNCSFLCDDMNPQSRLCCDDVWVPPLRLPGCDLSGLRSSSPMPSVYYHYASDNGSSFEGCRTNLADKNNGSYNCLWSRLWYLNIDAVCKSEMDFHNFPFDVQILTVDIFNPFASRTWFQLTKGFLERNVGEGINDIQLSPDSKIAGWYVKNVMISGTCGVSLTWKETFLTQNSLLIRLRESPDGYVSQEADILEALTMEKLHCVEVEDVLGNNQDFTSSLKTDLYLKVRDVIYRERLNFTLQNYHTCVQQHGKNFTWNQTILNAQSMEIAGKYLLLPFYTTEENIKRSFNLLDFSTKDITSKIWFPCAIEAVANLTTPSIRVSILVQRYRKFYLIKLILPTVAIAAFSLTVVGFQPQELMGRLSVVVPSLIALTALQALVVANDIPPIAYTAPSTLIILITYFALLSIAVESVLMVKWRSFRRCRCVCLDRGKGVVPPTDAIGTSPSSSDRAPSCQRPNEVVPTNIQATNRHPNSSGVLSTSVASECEMSKRDVVCDERASMHTDPSLASFSCLGQQKRCTTRRVDNIFMIIIALLYIVAILGCTLPPLHRSDKHKSQAMH